MTVQQRIDAFKAAFPDHPAAWPWRVTEAGRDVLYAVWVTGADYRTRSDFYGAYPHRFLPYLLALFPDVRMADMLHAFAGKLKPGPYTRLDSSAANQPDVVGNVYDAPHLLSLRQFQLAIADPPYSVADAAKYEALCGDPAFNLQGAATLGPDYATPGINQLRATSALARVLEPGGHLAWLDTSWPIHTKRALVTVGRIYLQRSTMHRTRVCSLFQRVAA